MLTILLTEDQFAIDRAGEQGEFVDYGAIATLTVSDGQYIERYIAMCDDPDGEPLVYRIADNLKLVRQPATTEDVELAGGDEDEGGSDDE